MAASREKLVRLLERYLPRLSPTQRRLAEYVLRKYQDVAFMGVAELATAAGVSAAAVVRFATMLDFQGYPEFQRALRTIIRSELRQVDRFTASLDGRRGEPIAERILAQEMRNLATLRSTFDRRALNGAVQQIAAAEHVTVAGFRASSTLAHYLWYNLRKVKPNVRLYTSPGSVTLDDIVLTDRGSLTILIAFPRYSRELLDLAHFVRKNALSSIGITDNELSPLVAFCRLCLFVDVGEISFTDFYAAPIALFNGLVAAVAQRLRQKALTRLHRLDDLAEEQGYLFLSGKRRRKS